jgi:HlyD family secretion protein
VGKKKRLIILLAIIVVGAVAVYLYVQSRPGKEINVIRVSGNIEVTDAEVSFKISGRVEQRLINEGQIIKAKQVVAYLDKTELAQEVNLRKAEIQEAQAALAELEAGSRPEEINEVEAAVEKAKARLDELLAGSRHQEIAVAEATVEKAKADMGRLKMDYERQNQLHQADVISTREFEVSKTAYEMARAKRQEEEEKLKLVREGPRKEAIEQAQASLRGATERYALVKKGPRKETIDQARARLRRAKETLAQAETRLGYATLHSPLSGIVLSENIEPGEYVAPGTPVITVGDLEKVWLRAYINETDLGRVKVGQGVRVTTDTYPGKIYEGRLSFISSEAEFTPKNVQTEKERVKLVYRVKVDIPNPQMELKPGMPADADIMLYQTK